MDATSSAEPALRVANGELTTVREAMRELNRLIEALNRGDLEKVVLTQRNRMRAVVVSLERFAELEERAAA
jgi:prevent-host-death family protein